MKYLKFFVGLIITTLSLLAVFRKIDFSKILQILSSMSIKYLLISAAFILLSLLFKSFRWQVLLKFFANFNFKDVFNALSIGNMFNMLLPFRSGDLVRAFALSKKQSVSKTSILGTVVYEHAVDLLALLVIFCIAILTYDFPISRWIKMPIFSLSFGCCIFFVFIFLFKEKVKDIKKWIDGSQENSTKFYFKVIQFFVNHILLNITLSYSWKDYLSISSHTLIMWIINGCWLYFLFVSLDSSSQYQFGMGEVLVLLLSTSLAVMIPSAPSYIGTLHLVTLIVLRPTGMPQELIISYAIMLHALGTLVAIAIGLISWISVLNFKEVEILKSLKISLSTTEKAV